MIEDSRMHACRTELHCLECVPRSLFLPLSDSSSNVGVSLICKNMNALQSNPPVAHMLLFTQRVDTGAGASSVRLPHTPPCSRTPLKTRPHLLHIGIPASRDLPCR
jgi:hypothetical protein